MKILLALLPIIFFVVSLKIIWALLYGESYSSGLRRLLFFMLPVLSLALFIYWGGWRKEEGDFNAKLVWFFQHEHIEHVILLCIFYGILLLESVIGVYLLYTQGDECYKESPSIYSAAKWAIYSIFSVPVFGSTVIFLSFATLQQIE